MRGMLAFHVGTSTVKPLVEQVGPVDHDEQLVLGDDAHHVDPAVDGPDEVVGLALEEQPVGRPRRDEPGVGGRARRRGRRPRPRWPSPLRSRSWRPTRRGERGVGAGVQLGLRAGHPDRLTVGRPGEVEVAAHRPRDEVAARPLGVGPERPNGDRSTSTVASSRPSTTAPCHGDEPSVSTTSAAASHESSSAASAGHERLLAAGEVAEQAVGAERARRRPVRPSPPGRRDRPAASPLRAPDTAAVRSRTSTSSRADADMGRSKAPPAGGGPSGPLRDRHGVTLGPCASSTTPSTGSTASSGAIRGSGSRSPSPSGTARTTGVGSARSSPTTASSR